MTASPPTPMAKKMPIEVETFVRGRKESDEEVDEGVADEEAAVDEGRALEEEGADNLQQDETPDAKKGSAPFLCQQQTERRCRTDGSCPTLPNMNASTIICPPVPFTCPPTFRISNVCGPSARPARCHPTWL